MEARSDEARRQEILVRAALVLASELSLPAVLQKIVELACEVADARYGALGVIGTEGRISEFVTFGITDEERQRIGPPPQGRGLLGLLIQQGEPVRLPRIKDHPASVGFPANHPPMNSFLGVPVAIRGRVFGNLYLTEKRSVDAFTQDDEDSVVQLAAQAAVAVENARLYQESQMGQRRLAAVNEIAKAMLEGRDVEVVLRLIADNAREFVSARVATVATPLGEDELIVRVASGDDAHELEGMVFGIEASISGEVMRTRKVLSLADASTDERAHQPIVRRGRIGPALFVPLVHGEHAFGTLVIGNRPGDRWFSEDDVSLVQTFAAQASVALEHARIQEELRRLVLVEDRERIAKELHDDVIQSLFAEGMALQASLSMLDDRAAMEARITQAVEHIDRVIRDLRNYIFALRPGAAADRALERTLRDIARDFSVATGVIVDVATDGDASSLLANRAVDIVQVAREAVSNAVRHSGGDRVRVSLIAADGVAVLEVADNGKGFDLATAEGSGDGLANLRERAGSLGGELDIESVEGVGTWVRIRIPI